MFEPPKIYVADAIGTDYIDWEKEQIIALTAPTGSGKTFFILNRLLPFAMSNNRHIMYLVNRKALKMQIEEEIAMVSHRYLSQGYRDVRDYVTVVTYQHLEQSIKKRILNLQKDNAEINSRQREIEYIKKNYNIEVEKKWAAEILRLEREIDNIKKMRMIHSKYDYSNYFYIICDEAHYFITDALFNTNTEISYNWVRKQREQAVLIMISATLDNVLEIDRPKEALTARSGPYAYAYKSITTTYSVQKDYSYLKLHSFDSADDILDLVHDEDYHGKWLIFWNDIKKGKELEKILAQNDIDAIFIDSTYEYDEETSVSVEKIAKDKMMMHDVIITTATLDNGISIHDDTLRNIVIMADNKEEFIQMLGRKRSDGESVNLFMCRRTEGEFKRRKSYLEQCMKSYDTCRQMIGYPGISKFEGYNKMQQTALAERMLTNPKFYSEVRKFLYAMVHENLPYWIGSVYKISALSIISLTNQIHFYETQIQRFQNEGEDAFLRTQLEWLEVSNIEECIKYLKMTKEERLRNYICGTLDEYVERNISKAENYELREKISHELRSLYNVCIPKKIQTDAMKKKQDSIIKNERSLSEKVFNAYMTDTHLPYVMEKPNAKTFIIYRK